LVKEGGKGDGFSGIKGVRLVILRSLLMEYLSFARIKAHLMDNVLE